jgi:hypothetical protein
MDHGDGHIGDHAAPLLDTSDVGRGAAAILLGQEIVRAGYRAHCHHPLLRGSDYRFRCHRCAPYAFAALATTASIAALVSLRDKNSTWLAVLFGLSAALIVQFHLLFVAVLPALLEFKQGWGFWRQFSAALVGFTMGILPAIHKFEIMYHTSGTHGFATGPGLKPLVSILTVRGSAAILVLGVLIEKRKRWVPDKGDRWAILLCLSLALVPSLILFGLSRATSMHVFLPRYLLVAVPGIAL